MADRYYSCEFGTTAKTGVSETATSTAAADVELRLTYDAAVNSKQAALMALDAIRQRIVEDTWPPV